MTGRDQYISEANARAHNARMAIPPREQPSRYDRLGPEARALLEDNDELDLADMLVTARAQLAALRAVARGYCPACGRGDAAPTVADWEQQKKRADDAEEFSRRALAQRQQMAEERHIWQERAERAEAAIARVRGYAQHSLKTDGPRIGLSPGHILALLDTDPMRTAATQATDEQDTRSRSAPNAHKPPTSTPDPNTTAPPKADRTPHVIASTAPTATAPAARSSPVPDLPLAIRVRLRAEHHVDSLGAWLAGHGHPHVAETLWRACRML